MTLPAQLVTTKYACTMYEVAGKRYQHARGALAQYALLSIALMVRDEYPTATHLIAGISDQGPHLTPDLVIAPGCGFDDNEVEDCDDLRDQLWAPISDLDDEDPLCLWMPFVTVNPDPQRALGRASEDPTGRVCSYALDLDLIIFCEGDARAAIALAEEAAA